MDAYVSLLTTSNTKLNTLGLAKLIQILEPLGSCIRESVQTLVPPVCKLLGSKPHSSLALQVLDLFMAKIGKKNINLHYRPYSVHPVARNIELLG